MSGAPQHLQQSNEPCGALDTDNHLHQVYTLSLVDPFVVMAPGYCRSQKRGLSATGIRRTLRSITANMLDLEFIFACAVVVTMSLVVGEVQYGQTLKLSPVQPLQVFCSAAGPALPRA